MASTTAPKGFGGPVWDRIRNARGLHGWGLVPVSIAFTGPDTTGVPTAYKIPVLSGLPSRTVGTIKIEAASLTSSVTFNAAAGAGSVIKLRTSDGAADLTASPLDNATTNIVAGTPIELNVDDETTASPKKTYMATAGGEYMELVFTKVGGGVNYSTANFILTVWLRIGPPAR